MAFHEEGRRLTQDQVHELHAHLCGTCGTSLDTMLNDWGLEEDDLTHDDLQEIDALMMICAACGWWCDTDEFCDSHDGNELICHQCAEDE